MNFQWIHDHQYLAVDIDIRRDLWFIIQFLPIVVQISVITEKTVRKSIQMMLKIFASFCWFQIIAIALKS